MYQNKIVQDNLINQEVVDHERDQKIETAIIGIKKFSRDFSYYLSELKNKEY
jgi:hypothetical protein